MIRFPLLLLCCPSLIWADPAEPNPAAPPAGQAAPAGQTAPAAEPPVPPAAEQPAPKPKPTLTKLEDGRMKFGEIIFDPKTRQVRIPCTLNMSEGLLEFAVVHENGKIHESLLITKCSPTDINVVMKLLRYVPSEELYAIEKEPGILSGEYPVVPEATKKAARVDLKVEWKKDGKTESITLADCIEQAQTTKPMAQGPWIYGGSMIYEGSFLAEQTGDVASIFVSRGSLLLYPGQDNFNDDVWMVNTKRVPPQGTIVDFVIQPHNP